MKISISRIEVQSGIWKEEMENGWPLSASVVFIVSSSLFLLNATVQHHLEGFLTTNLEAVASILRSIYVDNLEQRAKSTNKLYQQSKEIVKKSLFNLRKFTKSHLLLQARINKVEGTEPQGQSEGDLVGT